MGPTRWMLAESRMYAEYGGSAMYDSEPHDLHWTLERDLKLRKLAARLGDSGPPRRLHSETREGPSLAAAWKRPLVA